MFRLVLGGLLGLLLVMPASPAEAADAGAPVGGLERLPLVAPFPLAETSPPFELPLPLEQLPATEPIATQPAGGKPKPGEPKDAEKKDAKKDIEPQAAKAFSAEDAPVASETDFRIDWLSPRVTDALHRWCKPWSGSCELGVDGSGGNSDTFNIRLGLDGKCETKAHTFTFDLDYHKNTNDAVETANRLFFDSRYERPYVNTPWTWFVQQTTTYDEFQPWHVRVTAATGVGYHLVKTETTKLVSRYGGGFSHEIGGFDESYVPELNFGLDAEHHLTKRQKVKASVEYNPDVTDFSEFRVVSKVDWEVLLDEEVNLSMKLSAADRYKYPNIGGKPNDVDYSLVLLWRF